MNKKQTALAIVLVLVFWIGFSIIVSIDYNIPYFKFPHNLTAKSQFADIFGIINSLFSSLAFAFIIMNFIQQHKQTKIMQEEMKTIQKDQKITEEMLVLTKKELQNTEKALRITESELIEQQKLTSNQSLHMLRQAFESSFFNYLSIHNSIINSMRYNKFEKIRKYRITDIIKNRNSIHPSNPAEMVVYSGRDCFQFYYEEILSKYDFLIKSHSAEIPLTTEGKEDLIGKAYIEVYKIREKDIGNYCRRLYNIVDFVVRNIPSENDKISYARIIRSQLSSNEILILFYNALSIYGKGFIPYLSQFRLLKGISKEVLIEPELHWELGIKLGILCPDYITT